MMAVRGRTGEENTMTLNTKASVLEEGHIRRFEEYIYIWLAADKCLHFVSRGPFTVIVKYLRGYEVCEFTTGLTDSRSLFHVA